MGEHPNLLKLVTGVHVNMAAVTGPTFPNSSTWWTVNKSATVPGFACSTPSKPFGCLFNLSADPYETSDLALERPDDVVLEVAEVSPHRHIVVPRLQPVVEVLLFL